MNNNKKIKFNGNVLIIGFGSIGKAILPLILDHIDLSPNQITIIDKTNANEDIAKNLDINLKVIPISKENYQFIIDQNLQSGDFLLNLSTGISSIDLIATCQEKRILYLDASTEPWEGYYDNKSASPAERTNYVLREATLKLKGQGKPTAVITHGANPGLVSHFLKQALLNIAKDLGLDIPLPSCAKEWALLAHQLNIKTIHIAERDTQATHSPKKQGEFANTWSAEGFMSEAEQPAELSWGTHERHWPADAFLHAHGSNSAIYLNRSGASTKVRTWTPSLGAFHGFLITHAESISIANYLSLKDGDKVYYRPTVHYAYLPCSAAVVSLHEFLGDEYKRPETTRILLDDIVDGSDELGVLLMGHPKGAYWYGSTLSIQEARKIPYNNATSLQVAAGALGAMIWAIEHPDRGIVEPEELDFQYVLNIAMPYLGKVDGYYSDWNPLDNRQDLFSEACDTSDPWQFINFRLE